MKNIISKNKEFNIIICGTGGQGIITLQKILVEAARLSGFDVKSSELHGLSQRGGSVESHIRFGKKIFSPTVKQASADLILALEPQEALKACYYGLKNVGANFLVNTDFILIPFQNKLSLEEIGGKIKNFCKNLIFIDATRKSKELISSPVAGGIYMLGYALNHNFLPIDEKILLRAVKNIVKPAYFDSNKKVFEAAKI